MGEDEALFHCETLQDHAEVSCSRALWQKHMVVNISWDPARHTVPLLPCITNLLLVQIAVCLCASVTVFLTPHLLPPCTLLATEQCVYLSLCLIALVINATAPALEVSFSNRDFTPLDVICSDKPTEAILLLQLGRDNPSWCHITGGKSCLVYLCNKDRHYSLVNCALLLCSQTPTSAISLLFLSVWLMCVSLGLK